MKWRTTTPTQADGLILCEVDYTCRVSCRASSDCYLAIVDDDGALVYHDSLDDIGLAPDGVSRWVPYSEIWEALK